MNMVLRNFFYAVGLTALITLHGLDAGTAQFADLVRVVQSQEALKTVLALTMILSGLDLVWGRGSRRAVAFMGSAPSHPTSMRSR